MIELTCPQCSSELEIDDGFRGGVCRCFSCGTLMSVPDDPGYQKAQSLDRPEAPGHPGSPVKRGGSTTTGIRDQSRGKDRQKAHIVSDKSVDLSRVPTAQRRRRRFIVRASIVGIFALIVLVFLGATYYAFTRLKKPAEEPSTSNSSATMFGYDPTVNPLLLQKPNFMGLPIAPRTVLMADSSAAMRDSFDAIKAAAKQSVKSLGDHSVQVVLWRESGPVAYPPQMLPASQVSASALAAKLDDLDASGSVVALPAFRKALESKPELITLVVRLLPSSAEMRDLTKLLQGTGVRLNVVLIDRSDADARNLAQATGGTYIEIAGGDLRRWFEQLKSTQQK